MGIYCSHGALHPLTLQPARLLFTATTEPKWELCGIFSWVIGPHPKHWKGGYGGFQLLHPRFSQRRGKARRQQARRRAMSVPPVAQPRDPRARAYSLGELLSWDDLDFVRCAFATVLGRPADLDGESYYTNLLREGHSKRDILWKLRRSAEGRRGDPAITGFDRALRRAFWQRKLRWLFALSDRAERDSPRDRRHRAKLNEMALLRLAQAEQNRLLAAVLERLPAALAGSTGSGNRELPSADDAGRKRNEGQSSRERYVLDLIDTAIEQQ